VYKIKSILRKDKPDKIVRNTVISYEKSRYILENLDGTPLATQIKLNNPNAVRKSKRFFASDFLKVSDPEKETYLKSFTIDDALKLNKLDKRSDLPAARALPRPVPIVRAVLPLPAPKARASAVVPVVPVVENLVGKEVHNTFAGFGKKLFIGKIMSYDNTSKKYVVKYADGYETEYTLAEIKKYLIREQVANVRAVRERRQVVVGGEVHYL
jgi:hypothetical protein